VPLYMISYDLRKRRKYTDLINQLRDWGCTTPLRCVWFGNLRGPAPLVRDLLRRHMDNDDGLMVVELRQGSDWATYRTLIGGAEWLRMHIHP
jgi:hypothetical protein